MAETKMEIIDGVRYKPADAQRVRDRKAEAEPPKKRASGKKTDESTEPTEN
ncbi:hypothetical protein VVR12_03300 [Rothia sp. LK2588]|uniref:hypothetical protein n=1 Tax=Rothia sp. LK2588 TaxID=3114369 RepID=UPI0034CF55F6